MTKDEIRLFLKQMKTSHFYKRIQFIQYKKEGLTHEQIALLLNVCLKTLSNWMTRFSQGGMEGLIDVSYNRRVSALCDIEDVLRKEVRKGAFSTVAECRAWLEKEQQLTRCFSSVAWFLKKNGIVIQKNQA